MRMGTVGWLLVVAVGVALGFSAGRLWPGTSAKITELERERDAAREDLNTYREEVGAHFETTAELFDKVTADYRGLYEHLAIGARQLGAIRGEAVESPSLAEPERRRLAAMEEEPGAQDRPDERPQDGYDETFESPQPRDEEAPKEAPKAAESQPAVEDEDRKHEPDLTPPEADQTREAEAAALMEEDARLRAAAANDESTELSEEQGPPEDGPPEPPEEVVRLEEVARPEKEPRTGADEPASEDEKLREHTGR
jgi:uncharacterized protein